MHDSATRVKYLHMESKRRSMGMIVNRFLSWKKNKIHRKERYQNDSFTMGSWIVWTSKKFLSILFFTQLNSNWILSFLFFFFTLNCSKCHLNVFFLYRKKFRIVHPIINLLFQAVRLVWMMSTAVGMGEYKREWL